MSHGNRKGVGGKTTAMKWAPLLGILLIFGMTWTDIRAENSPPPSLKIDLPAKGGEPEGAEVVRFPWRPKEGPGGAYRLDAPEDQHRIIVYPGVEPGGTYPVVVGFHGQPKPGKLPRDYRFLEKVPKIIGEMVDARQLRPFVLVLPVFRFYGQNWPGFHVRSFQKEVDKQLKKLGIGTVDWYLFGHSGAAGCGGEGLNLAHEIGAKGVGFFDTCLGDEWQEAIRQLRRRKIPTVNIHSVETAGFRPRQRPEYQSGFDFGRAYEPLGLKPVACPATHPGSRLRKQPYRCAATEDGIITAFVVDSGEGKTAHEALLPIAIRYFLSKFLGH